MIELQSHQFELARPLLAGLEYSLSARAALAGNNPGRIFVDRLETPGIVFALTVEGYLLVGDSPSPEGLEALRRLWREKIFTGEVFVNGDENMSLAVHPADWEARLPFLVPTHQFEKLERYHYLCRAVRFDWRAHLPPGYTVRRIDRAALEGDEIIFSERMRGWSDMAEMWGSLENFEARALSFGVLQGNTLVAWCVPDCAAGEQIDVGIITEPAHRRKGLAAIATAATVEACFERGYRVVGWHCNTDNVASWKTAEKVGFERHCTYHYYFCVYDLVDHLAELGWSHYQRGEYARTVEYFTQVFAQRPDTHDYYYHLAAVACAQIGEPARALEYLQAAAVRGWDDAEYTARQEAFASLQHLPGWMDVLAQMKINAHKAEDGE